MRTLMLLIALAATLPPPATAASKRAVGRATCAGRIAECVGTCGVYGPVEKTCQKLVIRDCVKNGSAACGGTETTTTTPGETTTTTTLAAFGAPCNDGPDCESGVCFDFQPGGLHCTQNCETAETCPNPELGCSGMGVCRVP